MNDEDFARHAFAAAFRSGQTGEPPTLPDVELLALHGRRANRTRHGLYAAGTTVVAGVAVAGVVTGPSLLGLDSPSPSSVGTGAQGVTTPPASPAPSKSGSAPDSVKPPSPRVPCATPATINWLSVVNAALPTGVTATAGDSANCTQVTDGVRSYEALFKLSTGDTELQVDVNTGPGVAAKLGAVRISQGAPATDSPSPSLDPAAIASLEAKKIGAVAPLGGEAAVAGGQDQPSPSFDAAAIASLQTQKQAIANAAATASGSPLGPDASAIKGSDNENCTEVAVNATACVSHQTKGSLLVVDVQLLRTGSSPLALDVIASNGRNLSTPAPSQLPSDATMLAIAQAVAAHF